MRSHHALARLPRQALPGGLLMLTASTPHARLTGLSGIASIPEGWSLWLPRCRSVHTFGMRFALDLVWLGAKNEVLRIDAAVAPQRMRSCLRARSVVEARSGEGGRLASVLLAQRVTASFKA